MNRTAVVSPCNREARDKGAMKMLLMTALVAGCVCANALHAETFNVTRFDDPLPDVCLPSDCSLREAASAVATNSPFAGTDKIQLAAGTYTLTRGEMSLGSSTQDLELVGAGSAHTSIHTDARLFSTPHDRSLLLRGVSFETTNSSVAGMSATSASASLLLDDIAVVGRSGSFFIVGDVGNNATLEIRNSSVQGVTCNAATGTCSILDSQYSRLLSNTAAPGPTIRISGSLLDGALDPDNSNTGIVIYRSVLVDIHNSTIRGARSGFRDTTHPLSVRLDRLTYADNPSPMRFGSSEVDITNSVFASNTSRAIYADEVSDWTISGTSFISNQVDGNSGGAIIVEDEALMRIENSTFSNNSFAAGTASGARGAAIGFRNGGGLEIYLRHVTIKGPSFAAVGTEGSAIGGFGGSSQAVVSVYNSIIAGSCRLDSGALNSAAGNIESAGHSCGFNFNNFVDVGTSALALGTLADHGGPTQTYEPAPNSSAVDSGYPNRCLAIDQRGYARPFGPHCDIGAVEVGALDTIFADGFD